MIRLWDTRSENGKGRRVKIASLWWLKSGDGEVKTQGMEVKNNFTTSLKYFSSVEILLTKIEKYWIFYATSCILLPSPHFLTTRMKSSETPLPLSNVSSSKHLARLCEQVLTCLSTELTFELIVRICNFSRQYFLHPFLRLFFILAVLRNAIY